MVLQYLPVDWPAARALCLAFRCDAWHVSHGNMDGFSESSTLAWFEQLASEHAHGFLHVWLDGQVIGQIEYRAPITWPNGLGVYINLLYLSPAHRGHGLGTLMHDYILADSRAKQCSSARLRVMSSNTHARHFYDKHGWQAVGVVDNKGAQLMVFKLENHEKSPPPINRAPPINRGHPK